MGKHSSNETADRGKHYQPRHAKPDNKDGNYVVVNNPEGYHVADPERHGRGHSSGWSGSR